MNPLLDLKLGKHLPVHDPRTLRLASYHTAALAPAPPTYDGTEGFAEWQMMANDQLGDCTIAMCGHSVQTAVIAVDKLAPPPEPVSDDSIINYYIWWDGYKRGVPSTDNGGSILNVIKQWRKFGFLGHGVEAYAIADPGNIEQLKSIIATFGLAAVGIGLPQSAQSQVGGIWDVVGNPSVDPASKPYSWGGHAICVNSYNLTGPRCVTWGQMQQMTWRFWQAYVDESYALLLRYLLKHRGISPSGYNLAQLISDARSIK